MTEPTWLAHARAQLGVKEVAGPKSSPTVLDYYARAAHPEIKDDAVPWCAAFVGAMLKDAGVKPSGSLAARSYEAWGQPLPGGKPVLGCVGVKKRAGGGWTGHVGFVVGATADRVFMLGGNQSDAVTIASFPRKDFTAFRWPANVAIPKGGTLPTTIAGAKVSVSEA